MKFQLKKRPAALVTSAVLVAGLLTGTGPSAMAATQGNAARQKPTVVLVHGGFADATVSWQGVVRRLQKKGYPVVAPANPLRGLQTDAPYLRSVLNSINGPIILVGHSYGGAVITNAAAGDSDVKALVYIAAFVPDVGEALGELIQRYPGSEIQAATTAVPFPQADGTTGTDLYLQPDKLRAVFAADLPKADTDVLAATQRPFSAQAFTDKTTAAAWRTIPSWGLVATQDKAIPAALERFEYSRAHARKVVTVSASHVAMVSHPGIVTNLIVDAAKATA
ncbi:alpha/beta hydrolase [Actinoplanes sp. M2I2]|uniref:alpha/beta hydrolase n=1 Tax=Actinoplanes sp. M2I2 TaxID=1734444 RepID=UPI002020BF92|nr:alpha/beta hydrolase [Actinoplanes sp. M2I2]